MNRHIVTALLLIAAIAFYTIGAVGPGMVFLILGGVAELFFWLRIFGRGQKR